MNSFAKIPDSLKKLHERAVAGANRSYSPYSQAKVGAAIELEDGQVFEGCNIENSSYGGTVCAERVAIWKAVSENKTGKPIHIKQVMVVVNRDQAWPPCGLCRQVIVEFGAAPGKNIQIHTATFEGKGQSFVFSEIFPHAFTPSYLNA